MITEKQLYIIGNNAIFQKNFCNYLEYNGKLTSNYYLDVQVIKDIDTEMGIDTTEASMVAQILGMAADYDALVVCGDLCSNEQFILDFAKHYLKKVFIVDSNDLLEHTIAPDIILLLQN